MTKENTARNKPVVLYSRLFTDVREGYGVVLELASDHPVNPELKAGKEVWTSPVQEVKSGGVFVTCNTQYEPLQ